MAVARQSHSAALLPNGKVLIVGSGVAELFDPATNALAATGSMSSPYGSTATSLAEWQSPGNRPKDKRRLRSSFGGLVPETHNHGFFFLSYQGLWTRQPANVASSTIEERGSR
jgi:hypothetical protein